MKIFTNDNSFYKELWASVKSFYPSEDIRNDKDADIKVIFATNKVDIHFFDAYFSILEKEKYHYEYYELNFHILAKKKLYEFLSNKTSKKLDWGILTGVRPSKLYRKLMGLSDLEQTRGILKDIYLISEKKIDILEDIYTNQKDVIDNNYEQINYVSVPFCPSKCNYCTFTSNFSINYEDNYIKTLIKEIEFSKDSFAKTKVLYIGGGTPTYLSDGSFKRLLEFISSIGKYDEFTVEAGRPDTITDNKLDIMKEYGVSRISINPQTFSRKTLLKVNRRHSIDDIYKSYNLAVKKGFKDINMDIILGLPDESISDAQHTVDELLKIRPSSITVHCLAIKKNNNLDKDYIKEHINKNIQIKKMTVYVKTRLEQNAYNKYYLYRQKNIGGDAENIGYCLDGFENIYNILMMEDITDVYGFGVGAVSKININGKIKRLVLPKNVNDYISNIDELLKKREELHFL